MIKKDCKCYPCHKNMDDCSFCYCPLYPCRIKETGGKLYKGIWDCSNCTILHNTKITTFLKMYINYYIKIALNEENK
jgi:Zn-finger protein